MIDRGAVGPKCPRCGWYMFALFSTHACPQGCDRIERGHCPGCDSADVEPFDTDRMSGMHCKSCGRVWAGR